MQTIKFKTNINCSGCVAKVTPLLNEEETIEKWDVNTSDAEKILTVETNEADSEKIIKAVEKAGFKIKQFH
jgi:copper chaperone